MAATPFGSTSVRDVWPYLGAAVTSLEHGDGHDQESAPSDAADGGGTTDRTDLTERTHLHEPDVHSNTRDGACYVRELAQGQTTLFQMGFCASVLGSDSAADTRTDDHEHHGREGTAPTRRVTTARDNLGGNPAVEHEPLTLRQEQDHRIETEQSPEAQERGHEIRSIRNTRSASWTREMLTRLQEAAWKRSTERMEQRGVRIATSNASFGRKSLMWNSYVDSLIPYPARVVIPNEATIRRMESAQRIALQGGTAWCPKRALSGMGIFFGIKGAPRCPRASTMAQGAWSHILGEPWGPSPARRQQRLLWTQAVRFANGLLSHDLHFPAIGRDRAMRAARIIIRMADARFHDPDAPTVPGTGHSLYIILWLSLHQAKHREWMRARSLARRWAVGNGEEWRTLESSPTTTDGARILRLLCNALPGQARWRPRSQRREHRCSRCDGGEVQLVWRSPSPPDAHVDDEGVAWCHDCLDAGTLNNQWASLPDAMLPPDLRNHAADVRGHTQPPSFDHRPSSTGHARSVDLAKLGPSTFGTGARQPS